MKIASPSRERARRRVLLRAVTKTTKKILLASLLVFAFLIVPAIAPAQTNAQAPADSTSAASTSPNTDQTASPAPAPAPTQHEKYSRLLNGTYTGVQLGYTSYPFSQSDLQPGFHSDSIGNPRFGVRFVLTGHEFNKYFSLQITEQPPLTWVNYQSVNGDQASHGVRVNVGGLTGKVSLPLNKKWSLFGEGGLGIVTLEGFSIGETPALNNAVHPTWLLGGGVEYHVDDNWSVLGEFSGTLARPSVQLPSTTMLSAGFNYTMRRVPDKPGGAADFGKFPLWPHNFVQVGYITDVAGYSVNDFFSKKLRIFWSGQAFVANGVSFDYVRNMFHTRRFFALDFGAGFSTWKSKGGQTFQTVALYPVLRFPLVRTNPAEVYVAYSVAGPAFISHANIDGVNTGTLFTFQDYIAAGVYLGKKRRVTAEVRIEHYSNGDLLPQDPGVTVPLGFYFGTTF